MSDYTSYDPLKVTVQCVHPVAGGHKVRAFGDDTMVDAGFAADFGEVFVSTDGEARHVDSADRSGDITIPLADNSPSNAFFAAVIASKEPMSVTITDKSSKSDLFFAGSVKLKTMPRMVKKKGNSVNEYVWNFTKGKMVMAGAEI
jgi:hypothetical protein